MLKMSKRLLENLVHGPVTRLKPREPFEGARGHVEIDIDKCIFCMRCMRECPSGCLTVNPSDGTWNINQFECIACGVCVSVCAKHAITMNETPRKPAYHKDISTYRGTPPVRVAKAKATSEAEHKAPENEKKESEAGTPSAEA
jgi:NADH-quinone oxidoreductase subunit I